LSEHCRDGDLVKFYWFELNGKINFGNHEICSQAAAELEEIFKADLKEMGLKFQQKMQAARLQTESKLKEALKNCSGEFYRYGKRKWEDMCKTYSQFLITIFSTKNSSLNLHTLNNPTKLHLLSAVEKQMRPLSLEVKKTQAQARRPFLHLQVVYICLWNGHPRLQIRSRRSDPLTSKGDHWS
jgi:hypothetical protein